MLFKSHLCAIRCHEIKADVHGIYHSLSFVSGAQTSLSQSDKAKPVEVLLNSLKNEGPLFLLKGWTPAFIRLGPNTVLMFVFFEVRFSFMALFENAHHFCCSN